MKLTPAQAEAIVRLQNNSDFRQLVEALTAYRHESIEFVMYGPPEGVETSRGIARGVTEVLRGLSNANNIIEKTRGRGH